MRKSLWMIPVVLLCALLGSTTARADTLVTNAGGYVTSIDGMSIDGITYNVTFGSTEDLTFNLDFTGAHDAITDINADLGYYPIMDPSAIGYAVEYNSLAIPSDAPFLTDNILSPWTTTPAVTDGTYNSEIALSHPGTLFWAEFSPVTPVTTPEPDTAPLTLSGLGMLGLLVVIRKRVARRHPQAT